MANKSNPADTKSPDDFSAELKTLVDAFGAKIVKAPKDQIVRPKCAGIDVHKRILVLSVCITDPKTSEAHFSAFMYKSTNSDIMKIADMLLELDIKDVCMESTGKYWIPIYNILEQKTLKPVITHPKYVKQLPGKKTDYTDAIRITSMFRLDLVTPSFIPPQDIRDLRELCRYRLKLTYQRTAEKNRFQNSMTISQIRIDSVLSNPFGKSATDLMSYLLETPEDQVSDEGILSCIDYRVRSSHEEILDSVHGFHFVDIQKFKMQLINKDLSTLNTLIDEIDCYLDKYRVKYSQQLAHLSTMPGLTEVSALYIISEIGADMDVWRSADSLCCWAGLTPGNHDSGGKHNSTRCNHAGHYLKPLLVQTALAAIRSLRKNPYFYYKYQRIKKRRGHKRAVLAIARMMLIAVYHMIKEEKDFHPCDYDELLSHARKEKVELTLTNTLQFLQKQGVDEETLNLIRTKCSTKDNRTDPPDKNQEENTAKCKPAKTKTGKTKTNESKKKQPSKVRKKENIPKENSSEDPTINPKDSGTLSA